MTFRKSGRTLTSTSSKWCAPSLLVLGIDPGTANTGYGVVRSDRPGLATLIECGVIRTRPREPLPARLAEIYDGVVHLIARHRPDAL